MKILSTILTSVIGILFALAWACSDRDDKRANVLVLIIEISYALNLLALWI